MPGTTPEQDGDGPPKPAQMLSRMARTGMAVVILMVGVSALWYLSSLLGSYFLRVVVGLVLGLSAAWLGVNYFRQVAHPPPPDPVPTEVHAGLRLGYLCEMCGLELAVLKVAKDRAPRHCGEAMVLVRREGAGD